MVSHNDAIEIARQYLIGKRHDAKIEPVVDEQITIERPFSWVFFYNSRAFLETGDDLYALIGNSPTIVDRHDGSIHVKGSAQPIEFYIEEYERQHIQAQPATVRNEGGTVPNEPDKLSNSQG